MGSFLPNRVQWLVGSVEEWKLGHRGGMIKQLKVCVLSSPLFGTTLPSLLIAFFSDWTYFNYLFFYFCFCCSALKKKKDKFEKEMEELSSIRQLQRKESEASEEVSGLERKIQYEEIEKVIRMIHVKKLWIVSVRHVNCPGEILKLSELRWLTNLSWHATIICGSFFF